MKNDREVDRLRGLVAELTAQLKLRDDAARRGLEMWQAKHPDATWWPSMDTTFVAMAEEVGRLNERVAQAEERARTRCGAPCVCRVVDDEITLWCALHAGIRDKLTSQRDAMAEEIAERRCQADMIWPHPPDEWSVRPTAADVIKEFGGGDE